MKVYIIVYVDPYTHGECEGDCCGTMDKEIKGVASTRPKAEELIARYLKRISYQREDFEIDEVELDGELS